MNWEMIGALGEIAGAAAVVISLVYLARQVAMSNRLAQAEASRAPTSDLNNLNAAFGTDPTFRQAFRRVTLGAVPADLTEDEVVLIEFYMISVANTCEQLFRELQQGVVEERTLRERGDPVFTSPFFRANWQRARRGLGASFVDYIAATYDLPMQPDDELRFPVP